MTSSLASPSTSQQIDAQGQRVGIIRADLQYTLNRRRHYVEHKGVANRAGPFTGRGPWPKTGG